MTSAFEYYNKKAKKSKINSNVLQINTKTKKHDWKSSTPLPRDDTPFFSISPDKVSPVNNVFLSPVLEKVKHKMKKIPEAIPEGTQFDGSEKKKQKKTKEKTLMIDKPRPSDTKKKSKNGVSTSDPNTNGIKYDFDLTKPRSKNKNLKAKIASLFNDDLENNIKQNYDSDNVFNLEAGSRKRKHKGCENDSVKKRKIDSEAECSNSLEKGRQMLEWILSPISIDDFFLNYWEKRPLHIARNKLDFFEGLCSKEILDDAFRHSQMNLQKNVTVTAYEDGLRHTDKTPGRARPNTIWEMFQNGQSIRLYNPQTFIPAVGTLVATLQEYFRCMVGVNSYLTPAGTQGFAPHYDDIEAFVLQVEGEKEWKVYPPRSIHETLPQTSSRDFDQNEIGEPILEVTLKAGDLLYFPRGFIHQARSVELHHSLHLTVSTFQCNTWGDFFKKTLPMALERAIAEDIDFRQGLPINFLDNMGLINEDSNKPARASYVKQAHELFSKLVNYCSWDDAADQLGKEFIHSSFPPPNEELPQNTFEKLLKKPLPKTSVRLIAANACRLTNEDGELVVYYSTDNSLTPREEDLLGFSVSPKQAAVFQSLFEAYPMYSNIKNLSENDGHSRKAVKNLIINLAKRALVQVK